MAFDSDEFLRRQIAASAVRAPAFAAAHSAFDSDAFLQRQLAGPIGVPVAPVAPAFGAPAAVQGFTPDPSLFSGRSDVGAGESFLRGGAQGFTLGFADELTGGVESLFTSKTYKESRDEARAAYAAAQEANPGAFIGGEIVGGLATALAPIPGAQVGALKALSAGEKLGRLALRGVAEGAVAGGGYSTAETAAGLARDVAIGAGAGAAGGTVLGVGGLAARKLLGKLAKGAPDRVRKRILADITGTTSAKARDKLLGPNAKNAKRIANLILDDRELLSVHADPTKLFEIAGKKITAVSEPLELIYQQVDKLSDGISAEKFFSTIDGFVSSSRRAFRPKIARMFETTAKELKKEIFPRLPADASVIKGAIKEVAKATSETEAKLVSKAVARQLEELSDAVGTFGKRALDPADLDKLISSIMSRIRTKAPEGVYARIGDALEDVAQRATQKGNKKITASQMRKLIGGLQDDAWEGSVANPTPIREALRELTGNLRDKLNTHVEGIIDRAGVTPKLGGLPMNIRELNGRMGDLINLRDVAKISAAKQGGISGASKTLTSGSFTRNALGNLGEKLREPATAGLLAVASPGVGAANIGLQLGRKGARAADIALAKTGGDIALPGLERTTTGVRRVLAGQAGGAGAQASEDKRQRKGLSTLAGMARTGSSPEEIMQVAKGMGIPPERVAEVIELFGPG